ncbi:putative vacuolar protein sorting-associated protein TDA6 [Dendroctonus ponderosae]|uniref:Vacuolar protein sorting-associated protein 62 n=1 Tax=Dendroctonus ponderosae TaxID=77166 RepID=J3JTZ8_DENPD|nr:putative vacuolar protein sorting-associated protein TDA6 [Dendroctonus ponderosae]AEE61671.1 unknown [Dendroctonus ponderosae]KAH1022520.1 hypothetical protein HUJ04_011913 [Dendroctonus ponderosae]
MLCGGISVIFFYVLPVTVLSGHRVDVDKVEGLVRQWAPLVWLSPEEKFMPSNVEEFLVNTNIADEHGSVLTGSKSPARFFQYNSKKVFLVPKRSLDSLKENYTSFLYGKSPKSYPPVPIYAVVTYCSNPASSEFPPDLLPTFHVTYWMFYPFNEGKDSCFLGKVPAPLIFSKCFGHYRKLGNHFGDWEHMSLSFSGHPYPDQLFLSVHDAGAYYAYQRNTNTFRFQAKMERKGVAQVPSYPEFIRLQGGHPVLFAAEGSHGLWSTPGDHEFIRVPKITDRTGFGAPWKTWGSIVFYHIGRSEMPAWMSFKGKWGNPKTKCILLKKFGLCEYTEGPRGLLRETNDFYC